MGETLIGHAAALFEAEGVDLAAVAVQRLGLVFVVVAILVIEVLKAPVLALAVVVPVAVTLMTVTVAVLSLGVAVTVAVIMTLVLAILLLTFAFTVTMAVLVTVAMSVTAITMSVTMAVRVRMTVLLLQERLVILCALQLALEMRKVVTAEVDDLIEIDVALHSGDDASVGVDGADAVANLKQFRVAYHIDLVQKQGVTESDLLESLVNALAVGDRLVIQTPDAVLGVHHTHHGVKAGLGLDGVVLGNRQDDWGRISHAARLDNNTVQFLARGQGEKTQHAVGEIVLDGAAEAAVVHDHDGGVVGELPLIEGSAG